jgi:hypothetical protein
MCVTKPISRIGPPSVSNDTPVASAAAASAVVAAAAAPQTKAGRQGGRVSATAVLVMPGVVVNVMVIGRSPDRTVGTSCLITTTNGFRRIDIADEEFLGDQPQRCPALERSARTS